MASAVQAKDNHYHGLHPGTHHKCPQMAKAKVREWPDIFKPIMMNLKRGAIIVMNSKAIFLRRSRRSTFG